MVLAAYAYAYGLTGPPGQRLPALGRAHPLFHLGLVSAGALALPPAGPPEPAVGASLPEAASVFLLLDRAIGLPAFAVAATSPLLARWLGLAARPPANPYPVYAASNAGYPLVLEPRAGLTAQSRLLGGAYAAFGVLLAPCAVAAWRRLRQSLDGAQAPGPFWTDDSGPLLPVLA